MTRPSPRVKSTAGKIQRGPSRRWSGKKSTGEDYTSIWIERLGSQAKRGVIWSGRAGGRGKKGGIWYDMTPRDERVKVGGWVPVGDFVFPDLPDNGRMGWDTRPTYRPTRLTQQPGPG